VVTQKRKKKKERELWGKEEESRGECRGKAGEKEVVKQGRKERGSREGEKRRQQESREERKGEQRTNEWRSMGERSGVAEGAVEQGVGEEEGEVQVADRTCTILQIVETREEQHGRGLSRMKGGNS
jgi:hypothetical protein